MKAPTKILIVDDHVLFREGLVSLLRGQSDFNIVGEASNVTQALQMVRDLEPEIVLMDFSLPDGSGAEASRKILAERPNTKIVFLTIHESDEFLFEAVRSGAQGYLLKNLPVSKLLASLRGLENDEAAISRKMMGRLMEGFRQTEPVQPAVETPEKLTNREVEVLKELSSGATNKEIAEALVISTNTVKNHVHNLMSKLDINTRQDLIDYARRNGIVRHPTQIRNT